jgi:hypothetical protein
VTKSGRNVWAKPGIKVIGPANFKIAKSIAVSKDALPYQKIPFGALRV